MSDVVIKVENLGKRYQIGLSGRADKRRRRENRAGGGSIGVGERLKKALALDLFLKDLVFCLYVRPIFCFDLLHEML